MSREGDVWVRSRVRKAFKARVKPPGRENQGGTEKAGTAGPGDPTGQPRALQATARVWLCPNCASHVGAGPHTAACPVRRRAGGSREEKGVQRKMGLLEEQTLYQHFRNTTVSLPCDFYPRSVQDLGRSSISHFPGLVPLSCAVAP